MPKIFYYATHKIIKKIFFFLVHVKMDQENIMFYKNQDKSYIMTDLYLNHNIAFGHKDSHNYYAIDINEIVLLKKK